MQYSDVFDLAVRLEALGSEGVRAAEAHAFRIWMARAGWGSTPNAETWAAIFKTAARAAQWLSKYEDGKPDVEEQTPAESLAGVEISA